MREPTGQDAVLVAAPGKAGCVSARRKPRRWRQPGRGVTVNAVWPGCVRTPLVERQILGTANARGITEKQVRRDVLHAAQPMGEFATTAQITGAALPVDGGWTVRRRPVW